MTSTMPAVKKKRPKTRARLARSFGYAWKLEDGSLCHWAEPELKRLIEGGHPRSPGEIGAGNVTSSISPTADFGRVH